MLQSVLKQKRGEQVSSGELWADHAALGRQIEDAEKAAANSRGARGHELVEALAEGNHGKRVRARRELDDAHAELEDLRGAREALAQRARAAEAKEKQRADAAAWRDIDRMAEKRLALLGRIDAAVENIAALYREAEAIEAQIRNTVPREQRPSSGWPTSGFGGEIGRALALRLKLAIPAADALVGGHVIYAPRSLETLRQHGEIGHRLAFHRRPAKE
jgi:hypothetical protein